MIGEDARRDDLILGRQLALLQVPIHAAARHAAHRRHAVRQPQLVDVFGIVGLPAAAVHVQIDEAGHDVHAGRVDLLGALRRTPAIADGHLREADARDLGDAILRDDEIHRPARRRAGAVDDRGAADDQPVVRTIAFAGAAIGRRLHLLRSQRNCEGAGEQRERQSAERWDMEHRETV